MTETGGLEREVACGLSAYFNHVLSLLNTFSSRCCSILGDMTSLMWILFGLEPRLLRSSWSTEEDEGWD